MAFRKRYKRYAILYILNIYYKMYKIRLPSAAGDSSRAILGGLSVAGIG